MHYEDHLQNPIIVALDKAGKEGAIEIIKELGRNVWGYKIGALLLQQGTSLISEIQKKAGSLNLLVDLQFTGNPEALVEYISVLSPHSTEISFIVVNANSGPIGIKEAVRSTRISRILVGSVIDSLGIADVNFLYGTPFREIKTYQFAKMGKEEGAHGIYCSVKDLEFLSQYPEFQDKEFAKIVYGVRPEWDLDHGTHKYVMTPREAMERGTTKFVIGGTIRRASNKLEVVKKILEEIKR